jgi:hypothetical protein
LAARHERSARPSNALALPQFKGKPRARLSEAFCSSMTSISAGASSALLGAESAHVANDRFRLPAGTGV